MTSLAGDPRFFRGSGPYTVAEVADAAGGSTEGDPELMLTGLAPLAVAQPNEVSFIDNPRYAQHLASTSAGAVLVHPDLIDRVPLTSIAIATATVYESWAKIALLFHPASPPRPAIHGTAWVEDGTGIDPTVSIGPFASIGRGVRIGACSCVDAHASIGDGVVIGARCRIGTGVSVSHALIGDRVRLHPGARIGQEGFGFATTADGYLTIPQLGRVILGDDVEIGANTTVDRGSLRDTVIGAGCRIDNLVQIGHNVRLGRCCVIVAQVGISGSTELGDFVQVGGQAAMAGHIQVGRGAKVGAQAGVIANVPAGAVMLGSPAQSRYAFFRQVAVLKKLAQRPREQGV